MPTNKSLDGIHTQKNTTSFSRNKKLSLFSSLKKTKKRFLSSLLILSLFLGGGFFFFQNTENIKGATYGWIQSNWGGGQTTNVATHTDNQENWTEFESKDPNIVADANGVSISGTNNSWVQTSDADFGAMAKDKLYVSGTGTNADIKLLKPLGATCSTNAECFDGNGIGYGQGFCNAGVCINPWISGPCSGISVFKNDVSGTRQWKTSDTTCTSPQCSGGNLVSDNSVDFSLYPARNACKAIGGRLPTISELQCIYTNRAVYDDYGAFVTSVNSPPYWSSTELSTTIAWYVYFNSGGTNTGHVKTYSFSVRCVRGN